MTDLLLTRLLAAGAAVLFASAAGAACEDVIALSKTSATTVRDRSSFETQARDFCKAEAQSRQRSNQAGGNVGYGGLSIGGSSASANSSMSYEQVCAADHSGSVRSDAYQSYMDTIAPGAFGAYERCLELQGRTGIQFSMDVAAKDLRIVARYLTNMTNAKPQTLRVVAPTDVTCAWESNQARIQGKTAALSRDSSVNLQCTRQMAADEHTIQVFVETMSEEPLFLRWKPYEGTLPIDALKALNEQVALAQAQLKVAMASLSHSVVAFNAERCPDGWDEFKPAYGVFVRGIDRSKLIDPDGERKPGNMQMDAFAEHTHTSTRNLIQDTGNIRQSNVPTAHGTTYSFATLPGVTNPAGTAKETRPRNVALLYCIRS